MTQSGVLPHELGPWIDAYVREVRLQRVVDGDTFWAVVDLGYDVHVRQCFRLLGYDAPECRGLTKGMGVQARGALAGFLAQAARLCVRSVKSDQYGRYLADVYAYYATHVSVGYATYEGWVNVNDELYALGFGRRTGPSGRRQPWEFDAEYPRAVE